MGYRIEVFYDGDCPLCVKEIGLLQWADRKRHRIRFTDIAADAFVPADTGLTMMELMDRIHGRLPDGTLVEGVEVFRHLYSAVGLSWLVALTRIPGISWMLDRTYLYFAKNRLKWTGRCYPEAGCMINRDSREDASQDTSAVISQPYEHVR